MEMHHRLGGLNNINLFFHSSGGWKFERELPTCLISDEGFFLACAFALRLLWAHVEGERASSPLHIRTPVLWD